VDGNLITSPHPDEAAAFVEAILLSLGADNGALGRTRATEGE